jgi:hypothetical protein
LAHRPVSIHGSLGLALRADNPSGSDMQSGHGPPHARCRLGDLGWGPWAAGMFRQGRPSSMSYEPARVAAMRACAIHARSSTAWSRGSSAMSVVQTMASAPNRGTSAAARRSRAAGGTSLGRPSSRGLIQRPRLVRPRRGSWPSRSGVRSSPRPERAWCSRWRNMGGDKHASWCPDHYCV